MATYTTDTTYNLAQQIKFAVKVSNVDYFYGPYDSLDAANAAIEEPLRMAGKTVGIITDGTVEEYWYQPNPKGSLELVKKLFEGGDIASISEDDINNLFN